MLIFSVSFASHVATLYITKNTRHQWHVNWTMQAHLFLSKQGETSQSLRLLWTVHLHRWFIFVAIWSAYPCSCFIPLSASAIRKLWRALPVIGHVTSFTMHGQNGRSSDIDPLLGGSAIFEAEGTLAIQAIALCCSSNFSSSIKRDLQACTLDVPFTKTSLAAQLSPNKTILLFANIWPHSL